MNIWLIFFGMLAHTGPCEMIANDRISGEDLAKGPFVAETVQVSIDGEYVVVEL